MQKPVSLNDASAEPLVSVQLMKLQTDLKDVLLFNLLDKYASSSHFMVWKQNDRRKPMR